MAAQQQVIDYGNTANDGQGDTLRDAFIKVDDNFANIWAAGPVGSNIQIVNNTIGVTNTNGNLILAPNSTGVVQTNNHIIPQIDSVYSLGSPNLRFRSAYVGYGGLDVVGNLKVDGTIFGNISLGSPIIADLRGSVIASDGVTVLVNAVSKSLYATSANITGNLSAGNISGVLTTSSQPNITSVGTLSLLNVTGNLSAANISGLIATASQPGITSVGTLSNLAVTGNITTAGYFIGDGSKISNLSITAGTSITNGNSNVVVAANSSVIVGVAGTPNVAVFNTSNVVVNGLITATGNVSGTYILGNGAFLTGLPANYGNANVADYLPTYTGNLNPGNVTATGNISGSYLLGNGAFLTGLPANYGNANVANYLPTYSGNLNSVSAIPGSAVTGSVALANIANIAYSVAGANVSGQVANAAYANISGIAYSVAVANVSGIGNIATINLDGNVANILRGDGTFAPEGGNLTANYANFAGEAFNVSGANVSGQVANALIAGTVYTNAQPNITSVGNLSILTVTGNITGSANISGTYILGNGAFLTGLPANYGNANVANYLPTYTGNLNSVSAVPGSAVTGTVSLANIANIAYSVAGANVSGQVANALIAGTVYTNAQPNITSVGELTSLDVSGNANLGNIGANNAVFTGTGSFGANVNMNNNWINSIGYPSAPTDAASKAYVDTMISSGIAYHQPVYVATTSNLAIATSGTTAYVQPNGAGNGVGSYISTTGAFLLIDSANVQTVGTRILVKDEANASWNGIYSYANTTAIIRATDADEYGPDSTEQLSINDFFFTQGGIVNEGVGFIVSAPQGNITFGTSNITFSIFTTSQVYDAGTGLTLTGTTFSISNTAITAGTYGNGDTVPTFTVNQQGQLTLASNVAITANAANLTGTTLASSIVNSSLTSVGTLANLTVTGNASVGNLTITGSVGPISVTGNITGGNLISTGNVTIGGGISLANSFGTLGQVLTSTGANGATWSSQFYVGNTPPQAQSIEPNYGDLWYYIGDDGINTLYVWLTDGSSDYFFDLLPPVFIN